MDTPPRPPFDAIAADHRCRWGNAFVIGGWGGWAIFALLGRTGLSPFWTTLAFVFIVWGIGWWMNHYEGVENRRVRRERGLDDSGEPLA